MKKLSIALLIAASCSYAGVVKTTYRHILKPVGVAVKNTAKLAKKVLY